MARLHSAAVALSFAFARLAAGITVGPVGDMVITNGDVTPDGFTRAAVLVNGTVPGPVVVGNKVLSPHNLVMR